MYYESMVNNIRRISSGSDVLLHHQRGMGTGDSHDGRDVGGVMV